MPQNLRMKDGSVLFHLRTVARLRFGGMKSVCSNAGNLRVRSTSEKESAIGDDSRRVASSPAWCIPQRWTALISLITHAFEMGSFDFGQKTIEVATAACGS